MTFPKITSSERKFGVALAGLLTEALSVGLLHGQVKDWAVVVLGALTAAGVRQVKNVPSVPPAA